MNALSSMKGEVHVLVHSGKVGYRNTLIKLYQPNLLTYNIVKLLGTSSLKDLDTNLALTFDQQII